MSYLPPSAYKARELGNKIHRAKVQLQKAEELLDEVNREISGIEHTTLVNYEMFCVSLRVLGFDLDTSDMTWRHPKTGACATVEALETLCQLHPVLMPTALKILSAGDSFRVVTNGEKNGVVTTVRIEPMGLLDQMASKI